MEITYHKEAVAGSWFHLPVFEQLGHIGSEISRASQWQGRDKTLFQGAVQRALELFDLTLADPRWQGQGKLREIARAREVFCDIVYGEKQYGTSLEDLDRYFLQFALTARKDS